MFLAGLHSRLRGGHARKGKKGRDGRARRSNEGLLASNYSRLACLHGSLFWRRHEGSLSFLSLFPSIDMCLWLCLDNPKRTRTMAGPIHKKIYALPFTPLTSMLFAERLVQTSVNCIARTPNKLGRISLPYLLIAPLVYGRQH